MSGIDYFTYTNLVANSLARAADINTRMAAVQGAFNKLPTPEKIQQGRATYCQDTGPANALAVALDFAPSSYVAGLDVAVRVNVTTTGAATLNVNGLGAKTILRADGTALQGGDLASGQVVGLVYDGSNFRMLSVSAVAVAGYATAAANSASAASTSATNAANSATSAASAASSAATTAAANVQSALAASQSAAATSATNAANSATAAAGSASAAATSATNAANSATAAASSASAAATSATNAANSASTVASSLSNYAALAGAAFTGAITVQAPSASNNPATKAYVDAAVFAAGSVTADEATIHSASGVFGLVTQNNNTVLGNVSGSTAKPSALTGTQVTALLDLAVASGAKGLLSGADKAKLDGISGSNTGDQTITLTGDVTGSGTGSFAASIGANKVTRAMLSATSGAALLGATGAGNVSDLTGTQVTALLDTFDTTHKGLVPSPGSATGKILSDGGWITPSSGGTVTSVSVVTANGVSGSVATATTTPAITITLGAITPSSVAATGSVTGSNLSGTNTGDQFTSIAAATLVGRASGAGTGAASALTATQAKTLLAIAASDVSGLAAVATSGSATDLSTGTLAVARGGSGATTVTGTGANVLGTAPTLSNPVVGTQTAGDNSTKAASTAFVQGELANYGKAFVPPQAITTSKTLANSDNLSTIFLTGGSGQSITAGSTPTAGFTCIIANVAASAWTFSCAGGCYTDGATATVTSANIAAGARVTAIHKGSGVWLLAGV